mmetsp:Transcript_27814/g.60940  ORF Transcript_27814/g.60940 Transcript_27814/m.60940 type:complete len:274 (+) Transcript_27814:1317-2138(+)
MMIAEVAMAVVVVVMADVVVVVVVAVAVAMVVVVLATVVVIVAVAVTMVHIAGPQRARCASILEESLNQRSRLRRQPHNRRRGVLCNAGGSQLVLRRPLCRKRACTIVAGNERLQSRTRKTESWLLAKRNKPHARACARASAAGLPAVPTLPPRPQRTLAHSRCEVLPIVFASATRTKRTAPLYLRTATRLLRLKRRRFQAVLTGLWQPRRRELRRLVTEFGGSRRSVSQFHRSSATLSASSGSSSSGEAQGSWRLLTRPRRCDDAKASTLAS